jgi:hypothetical protein
MAKFKFAENVADLNPRTARLGSASGSANAIDQKEIGKFVKLGGDSHYVLASAGDQIERFVVAVEAARLDDFSIGSVAGDKPGDRKAVILDGIQATPGTGTIAIGDYVVVGSVAAKGTELTDYQPKVCKATLQPGTTVGTVTDADPAGTTNLVNNIAAYVAAGMNAWRLVSASGTAVGSTGIIERV